MVRESYIMWDMGACPRKKIRPSEVEFESHFSTKPEYLLFTECSSSDSWKSLRIIPSEFECESDFSNLSQ